jgi:hypothetical protein
MAFTCGDEWRINPLSFKPGGVTVISVDKNNRHIEYPRIKNPRMYIAEILKNPNIKTAYIKPD